MVTRTVAGVLARALPLRYFDGVRLSRRSHPRLFRPWLLVSAAWVVPAGFAAINRIAQTRLGGWSPATARDLLWEGGDWLLYAFLTPAVFAVSKRPPWSGRIWRGARRCT